MGRRRSRHKWGCHMASRTKIRGAPVESVLKSLMDHASGELGAKETVKVACVEMTGEKLAARAGQFLERYDLAQQRQAEARKAVADRNAVEPEAHAFVKAAIIGLEAHFGPDAVKLGQAGVPPLKPKKQLTVKEKTAARERANQTRELRHTMGRRQKEAIKAGPVAVSVDATAAGTDASAAPAQAVQLATAPAANDAMEPATKAAS